jgi:Right handed beta helix region
LGKRRNLVAYLMGTLLLFLLGGGIYLVESFGPSDAEIGQPEAVTTPTSQAPSTTGQFETLLPDLEVGPEAPPDPVPTTIPLAERQIAPTTAAEPADEPDDGRGSSNADEGSSDAPADQGSGEDGSLQQSGPVVISGESGVVIENLAISNPDGPCVEIVGSSDVVVRNSEIGPCGGRAVEVENSSSVQLTGLSIRNTESGVYALQSQSVAVTSNVFRDAGRNFVQFDKVSGSGNQVSNNSGGNRLGGSSAEDFVSIYQSSGTSGSPLSVTGNSFRNGGPSTSGSGIMVGDYGGANIVVKGNSLVNPGQVGIGVPGGSNIKVLGNSIFSSPHPWSNVGIYVWGQSGSGCSGIEVSGNNVEWYNADGAANPAWDGGNCGAIAGWENNNWNADLG